MCADPGVSSSLTPSAYSRAVHPLRAAAELISPQIRRDRGDGLYILRGQAAAHPYFQNIERHGWTIFIPSKEGMQALDRYLDVQLQPGFIQFIGRPSSAEDISLLCRGIKLMETVCSEADVLKYEYDVRRRAALILRQHDKNAGGALPLCMRIAEKILRDRKETEK